MFDIISCVYYLWELNKKRSFTTKAERKNLPLVCVIICPFFSSLTNRLTSILLVTKISVCNARSHLKWIVEVKSCRSVLVYVE